MPLSKTYALICLAVIPAAIGLSACASAPARDASAEHALDAAPVPAGGADSAPKPSNPQAWHCKARTPTGDFDTDGPTQLVARQLAVQACIRQHLPEQCQKISCKPNP